MSRYLDGAPLAHLGLVVDVFRHRGWGQGSQARHFLLQLPLCQAIASLHHLPDEAGVVVDSVEIAAAPQDEGLVDGVLEAVVGVLSDAVFMALAGIDAGGAEAIVVQQGGVIVVKSAARGCCAIRGWQPRYCRCAPPLERRPGSRGHSAIPAATPGRSHRRRPRRSATPSG